MASHAMGNRGATYNHISLKAWSWKMTFPCSKMNLDFGFFLVCLCLFYGVKHLNHPKKKKKVSLSLSTAPKTDYDI